MGTKLQQGCVAENPRSSGGILLTWELQHELRLTHRLQGGLSHTKTVDPTIEHGFHRFHLFGTNPGDLAGWLHFNGELTAAPQIEAQFQRRTNQKHPGGDRQGKNKGKPTLITRHQRQMPLLTNACAASTI